MTEEIWKAVQGYEGAYEVSNLGRVRSLNRMVLVDDGWKGTEVFKPGKMLKLNPNLHKDDPRHGSCYSVKIYDSQGQKSETVASLVLTAFVAFPPTNESVAIHKDGNWKNNSVENLFWGTREDIEEIKKFRSDLVTGNHRNTNINSIVVEDIINNLSLYSIKDLAVIYNLSEAIVYIVEAWSKKNNTENYNKTNEL